MNANDKLFNHYVELLAEKESIIDDLKDQVKMLFDSLGKQSELIAQLEKEINELTDNY